MEPIQLAGLIAAILVNTIPLEPPAATERDGAPSPGAPASDGERGEDDPSASPSQPR
jgi:hypothetical protein